MNNKKLLKTLIESIIEADDTETKEKEAPEVGTAKQAAGKLSKALKSDTVTGFVNQFKSIASDPKVQAILKAGLKDGNPDDEKLSYSKKSLSVYGLRPTQNEIGFDESIQNILTDKYGSLDSILNGNADMGSPIVTYNGKYIIDGHHRWSQVFAANPKAKIDALDIKGELQPKEVLKVVHAAIAAKIGKLPLVNAKGINILKGVTEKQVSEAVDKHLSDKAKEIWAKHGEKDNKSIAKRIFLNLKKMAASNKPDFAAPPRSSMPQTGEGGAVTDKLNILSKGVVNFRDPKSTDVKKEVRALQERAGLRSKYI